MSSSIHIPSSPSRDDLKKLLAVRDGSLSEVPFERLLLAVAVHERTATLDLRRNALQKQIVFEEGVPVECRSNIATESLGRFLVATGRISEEDHHATLTQAASAKIPFEEMLVERELVPARDLLRLLQHNHGRKLLDAFTWRSGSFRLRGDVPRIESPLQVRVPQLIFTAVMKLDSDEEVDATLLPLQNSRVGIPVEPLIDMRDLKLTSGQQQVLDLLASGPRMYELEHAVDMPREELRRLLCALVRLGVAGEFQRAATRAAEIPPPAEERVSEDAREVESRPDPDELMKVYLSFRRKDPFDLLGVADDSGISAIMRAYLAFAERFVPSRFAAEGDGLREKAEEIFLAGARAYAELADPDRRAALAERRRHPASSPEPQVAAPAAEQETLVDPDALFARGRELVEKGLLRDALSYLEMAADCDIQNGTYAAELAYTRYQLLISTATLTMKTLKDVMRIDPRCGPAYLYTGLIHATLGNRLEAEGYLHRAAKLMPRDRRPAEALRTLQ